MRKIMVLVWVLLLLGAMTGAHMGKADEITIEKTIFFDDFESYPVGQFPSSGGWSLIYDGKGVEYQKVITDVVHSGTKAFQMWSATGCWSSNAEKRFTSNADLIGFELDVWAEDKGTMGCGEERTSVLGFGFWNKDLATWGKYYTNILFAYDGNIYAWTNENGKVVSKLIGTWEPKKWYHFKVVVNRKSNTYSIYMDGKLLAELKTPYDDTENINAIMIGSGHSGSRVVYDNVRVFEVVSSSNGNSEGLYKYVFPLVYLRPYWGSSAYESAVWIIATEDTTIWIDKNFNGPDSSDPIYHLSKGDRLRIGKASGAYSSPEGVKNVEWDKNPLVVYSNQPIITFASHADADYGDYDDGAFKYSVPIAGTKLVGTNVKWLYITPYEKNTRVYINGKLEGTIRYGETLVKKFDKPTTVVVTSDAPVVAVSAYVNPNYRSMTYAFPLMPPSTGEVVIPRSVKKYAEERGTKEVTEYYVVVDENGKIVKNETLPSEPKVITLTKPSAVFVFRTFYYADPWGGGAPRYAMSATALKPAQESTCYGYVFPPNRHGVIAEVAIYAKDNVKLYKDINADWSIDETETLSRGKLYVISTYNMDTESKMLVYAKGNLACSYISIGGWAGQLENAYELSSSPYETLYEQGISGQPSTQPIVYHDSLLTFNLKDYSTLKFMGDDWLKNYPDPKLPYLWITVSTGTPAYYSDFRNGYWENIALIDNNSEETTYELSTHLNGGKLGTLLYKERMTFYKNTGLIKIERPKVLDKGWAITDTINGISPGGDTKNDYIVSSEFDPYPINYEETFCTGTSWTACQKYKAENLKGYKGYVFLASYDSAKKQGFAIIVPKEYVRNAYSDIEYSALMAFFTKPTVYWKYWRWYISILTDSTKDVTYYRYFYRFTDDPITPIKKLIDSGMNPEVARKLASMSTSVTTPTNTQTSTLTHTTSPTSTPAQTTSTSTLAPIAKSNIDTASQIISKIPSSVDVGDAKTMLDEAQKAYENGDYELAKKFAETAQALAVKAYYDKLKADMQVKESQGYDVSKASNLLQQAYDAYNRKDYTKALEILVRADMAIQGVVPVKKPNYALYGALALVLFGGIIVLMRSQKSKREKLTAEFTSLINSGDNIVGKDQFGALEYYSKAFQIAKQLKDSKLIAKAQEKLNTVKGTVIAEINSLIAKGNDALDKSDYDKALAYYRQSLSLAEKLNDEEKIREANTKVESVNKVRKIKELLSEGDVLMEGEKYSRALGRYKEALEIAKAVGDSYFVELLKGRMSKANEIVEKLNTEVSSLVGQASRELMEENYESAIEKLSQALVLAEKIGGTVSVEDIKAKLEEAKKRKELRDKLREAKSAKKYTRALTLLEEALTIAEELGDERTATRIKHEIEEVKKAQILETLKNSIILTLPKELSYGREVTLSINVENNFDESIESLIIDLSELSPYFTLSEEKVVFPPIKSGRKLGKDIIIKPQFKGDFDFNIKISSNLGETVKTLKVKVGDYYTPAHFTPKPLTPKAAPEELEAFYENFQYIGEGGFARVFKAKRKKDGKIVAVKIPKTLDPATGKAFVREISNWLHLKHPNIVELHDVNVIPIPYLEMEYCEGSLAKLGKPMDVEQAAHIVFNIAEGLKYAHSKKIVHRDLKPSNVLLKAGIPKISDWGLSKLMSESRSSTLSSFTPYYAAPEQLSPRRFGHTDGRTDIWQLGVLFYELVTGKLPFEGSDLGEVTFAIINEDPVQPSKINPEAKLVEHIIMKMLAKKKEERYQSIEEVQRDLAKVLNMTYVEGLKKSRDLKRTLFYIGDLALINLKAGDLKEALKYLLELREYAGKYREDLDWLISQVKLAMEEGVKLGEEAVMKADVIVHQIKMGR